MRNYTTLIAKSKIGKTVAAGFSLREKINWRQTKSAQALACGCLACACLVIGILSCFSVAIAKSANDELGPWSAMLYRGNTATQVFGDAIIGKYNSYGEVIYAAELAYSLDKNNLFRRIFSIVFDEVQAAGNLAYRHDYTHHDQVKEGNLYIIWRFSKFPWQNYLRTTIAIGDGISYASHSPFADRELDKPVDDFNRLLNYLMLEVTFALSSHPQLQLVLRAHHRCTAWGTFSGNPNAGSTNVGLGVRYYF